jgi:hypothetical protein
MKRSTPRNTTLSTNTPRQSQSRIPDTFSVFKPTVPQTTAESATASVSCKSFNLLFVTANTAPVPNQLPDGSSASATTPLSHLPTPAPPRPMHPALGYHPELSAADYWSHHMAAASQPPWESTGLGKRRWDWDETPSSAAQAQMDMFLNDLKKRRLEPTYDPRESYQISDLAL